eukprot:TRINITY_DN1159_c0_g4_i1.p2 TRINITY_DN1159_c0_g4~~TRINITY_DN1159_c0_g4_i1.p2  ORF type:complete len:100 (+),score=7.55 TRINITY_DN1159_c0_g4_i1:332-631(+)
MISADAPALFAKACEMFITELTYRAWFHTEENKRRTLQRSDISMAISRTDIFDFLVDVIPKEDLAQYNPQSVFLTPLTIGNANSDTSYRRYCIDARSCA